jgi:hypothetical protein
VIFIVSEDVPQTLVMVAKTTPGPVTLKSFEVDPSDQSTFTPEDEILRVNVSPGHNAVSNQVAIEELQVNPKQLMYHN